jgi:pimeloyl-ACP methyl ester carboxylesterase
MAPDGVQIAYSRIGRGPPLVKTGNWMTHLEFDFESPIWRHLYRELARDHTLIRYDARGNGLSDREVEDISFETLVHDLETVVDAAGVERFALLGISQGCAVSVGYAVKHPERVTHLVLYGGFAVGWNKRARTEAEKQQHSAMVTLMRLGWGQQDTAFRQLFTSQFIPGGSKQQADWFNELQRISTSPADAVRNFMANGNIDVTNLLAKLTVPTLVMHARDDARVPFDAGRRMAAGIPGARFVPLPSRNHLILEDEPAGAVHEIVKVERKSGDFQVEIENRESVRKLYQAVGSFDAVAIAAGEVAFAPLSELTAEKWQFSLGSKLMGQINLVQEAIPFINEKGSFTLVSGVLNEEPIFAGVAGATVSGALEGFVRAAAVELPKGLRINVVSPTILKESEAHMGSFFPGVIPVEGWRVAQAYKRAILGVQTGRVYKVD